jgi:cytoskeleton-associated protein 5
MVAAQCLEGLAKGLMGNYGRYREIVVPPMLDRLKERKASVTETISAALHAIFETVRETYYPLKPSLLITVADHISRHYWRRSPRFVEQKPPS